ncbi:DNA adenine methylase [Pelosinus sp. sgz500959]|uniref:DNA adenine methylase n=1 Tax=Pelosinus sp. sgz500959 TaxID=3242472 RepID=UPI0036734194
MPTKLSLASPLRYPGSKASLCEYVSNLLQDNYLEGCSIIEPYAGSAIISLELLNQGIVNQATIIERDPLIYSFWQSVFTQPNELIQMIHNLPINLDTWNSFQIYKDYDAAKKFSVGELGLAGIFFNRTNFSGILKAGPIGGRSQLSKYKIDCRFNKERLVEQIETISKLKPYVTVVFDDAIDYLKKNKKSICTNNTFLYVDPPYYEKGASLYRYWYEHEEHKQLAKTLLKYDIPWLVSYDNHKEIKKFYSKAIGMQGVYFDYSVSKSRKEQELLISNLEIPPFFQEIFKEDLA